MGTITLKVKNSGKLISFLQRFVSIDNSVLIKMDGGKLSGATNNQTKEVVKCSSIDLEEIFDDCDSAPSLKIGIVNIAKVCTAIKMLKDEFAFTINYSDATDCGVANGLNLKDDNVEVALMCGQLKLFTEIPQNRLEVITSPDGAHAEFMLTKDSQTKLAQLMALDSDDKELKISFESFDGKLKAVTKSSKMIIGEVEKPISTGISRKHYTHVDKEDMIGYVKDGMILFMSNESDTKIVIGEAD